MAGKPDTRAETIGGRLRRLRLEQGVSQRELSAPGTSYAYISRIEAGTRQPSVKALRMLAAKLGVTPEYLETGSELAAVQLRELKLAEQELRLRLEGDTDEREVRAILADAEAQADVAAAVRARVLLGFRASAEGDYAGAVDQLERVVGTELVTPCSRPDVYATLGHAYSLAGSPDAAVALFEQALAELARSEADNRAAEVRYATYLSYALTDRGDIARARALLAELWARSAQVEDRYTQIRLYWSLGRVALEDTKPLAALDNFRRAVALLEATEDAVHLARAHIACADAALRAGEELAGAAEQLHEAERLLQGQAGRADLAALRRLQSLSALQAGEPARAAQIAGEALELARGFPGELGRSWWALALARAADGNGGAEQAFLEALTLLREHGGGSDHDDVLAAYARYLRSVGREHDARALGQREPRTGAVARSGARG